MFSTLATQFYQLCFLIYKNKLFSNSQMLKATRCISKIGKIIS